MTRLATNSYIYTERPCDQIEGCLRQIVTYNERIASYITDESIVFRLLQDEIIRVKLFNEYYFWLLINRDKYATEDFLKYSKNVTDKLCTDDKAANKAIHLPN